jgi:hypothetical protein
MKNLKLLPIFCLSLSILSCNNIQTKDKRSNKKTQLKGDFVVKQKTIKNDSTKIQASSELKNGAEKIKPKVKIHQRKLITEINETTEKKEKAPLTIFKQEPHKIPEKWSEAYSNDPEWVALYDETSDAFIRGWANEFVANPNVQISRDELIFAYRRRMEKIFFETPSFIEFCVSELDKSEKFKTFLVDFDSNVQ